MPELTNMILRGLFLFLRTIQRASLLTTLTSGLIRQLCIHIPQSLFLETADLLIDLFFYPRW